MENNLHDIEQVERYLDRSLSASERKDLERRMTEDPQFKNLFLEYRQLIEGIRYTHLKDKLLQLKSLEHTLGSVDVEKREGKQAWLQVNWKTSAAIAAAILFATISYLLFLRREDPQVLYARYFEPYPNVFEPTVRGENKPVDKHTAAFRAYDLGDYPKAVILFNELLQEKEEPGILLLLGNANLMTGHTADAQNNFRTLIKNFDELDGQAKWYLGLSYLKEGQTEKARMILEELGDPEVTYSKKANELLKKVH